jgi:Fe-Mn family superoxide dismutase
MKVMKREYSIFASLLMFTIISCNNKKLTEVVEVPLPSKEDKMLIGSPDDVKADEGTFQMAKLPYGYEALAPNIDALSMELHYSKHYLTYTNNLNKAIAGTELDKLPIEEVLKKLDVSNNDLRNNAGGYYNHGLFWENLAPKSGGEPKDSLAVAIARDFGSFNDFKNQFEDTASKQFGSGWTWMVTDKYGKLQITSTANQDNPLMSNATVKGTPILALDVWEHAYYLNYQYKRKKYIDGFFKVINWKKVAERYEEARKAK